MEYVPESVRKTLLKQQYRIVGTNSAVKICTWLKRSLLDKGYCYKQKFYGIESHRCLQMTPALMNCSHKCIFCWRPIEWTKLEEPEEWDDVDGLINGCIEAQRELISGFGGTNGVNKKKFEEAQTPNQVAISLAGEPTMYPRIGELISEFNERDFTTYLVTNGTLPERLKNLESLPTQLYVSLDAPNEDVYKKTDNPIIKGGWEKINETLSLLPSLDTRKVIRLTLVRDYNNLLVEDYGKLISKAEPEFIEVKSYMCVGFSRKRLTLDNMLSFDEIKKFSEKLSEATDYKIKDWKEDSRVVLLAR